MAAVGMSLVMLAWLSMLPINPKGLKSSFQFHVLLIPAQYQETRMSTTYTRVTFLDPVPAMKQLKQGSCQMQASLQLASSALCGAQTPFCFSELQFYNLLSPC